MYVQLLVLVSLSLSAYAFFFDESQVTAIGPVDATCENLARQGSCDFYDCLHRRFPCGRSSYARNHGMHYCQKYARFRHMFNELGQTWLDDTQACMTQQLLRVYRLETTTCRQISREGFSELAACYVNSGFCNIFWDNKEALWKVFEASDLIDRFEAIRVWREIIEIAGRCAGQELPRFLRFAISKLFD